MSTRADDRAGPDGGPVAAVERREKSGERRDDRARGGLEMFLDAVFRPAQWASRLAYSAGLQTGRPVEMDHLLVPVARTSGAPPLKIAFASDFHAGATTHTRILEEACAAMADAKPDVVLLGGDFVTTRARYIEQLEPFLASIPAPLGKFGVFGNHDRRANRGVLARSLERAGVRMLVNEAITLPAPHDDVVILGLDDPIRGAPEYRDAEGGVRIVLMHAPDGLMTVGDRHYDLAVCGHTHGGQITAGGIKPYLPYGKLSREYAGGLYRLGPAGERALVVSRGVGCSTVPIRIGASAQVHLFTVG